MLDYMIIGIVGQNNEIELDVLSHAYNICKPYTLKPGARKS